MFAYRKRVDPSRMTLVSMNDHWIGHIVIIIIIVSVGMRRGGDRNVGSVYRLLPRLSCNQKSQQIKFETLLLKGKDKHNSKMIQFCAAA